MCAHKPLVVLADRPGPLYAEPLPERRSMSEHAGRLLLPVQRQRLVLARQKLHRSVRFRRSRWCRENRRVGHYFSDDDDDDHYDHDHEDDATAVDDTDACADDVTDADDSDADDGQYPTENDASASAGASYNGCSSAWSRRLEYGRMATTAATQRRK